MANNNLQLAFSVPYRYVITERSFITAQVIGWYFYYRYFGLNGLCNGLCLYAVHPCSDWDFSFSVYSVVVPLLVQLSQINIFLTFSICHAMRPKQYISYVIHNALSNTYSPRTAVALPSHCRRTAVALSSHCRRITSFYCWLQCDGSATAVRWQCDGSAMAVRRQCDGSATAVRRQCDDSATAVRRQCEGSMY